MSRRRFRCSWCGNYLRKDHFKSPGGPRFCDGVCYAEDVAYEAKRRQEERQRQQGAEAFVRGLFSAFGIRLPGGMGGAPGSSIPTAGAIPPELYKKLIFLCHPDKHNNHEWAQEVTRWLLDQRKQSQQ